MTRISDIKRLAELAFERGKSYGGPAETTFEQWWSTMCPSSLPPLSGVAECCSICAVLTEDHCSDCAIDYGKGMPVCKRSACRDAHEAKFHDEARDREIEGDGG